jgi:hypothetical protein
MVGGIEARSTISPPWWNADLHRSSVTVSGGPALPPWRGAAPFFFFSVFPPLIRTAR